VEGEILGVVCGGQDWMCDIPEGSCEVGERKKSSLGGGVIVGVLWGAAL